jgi:hypothetical protein
VRSILTSAALFKSGDHEVMVATTRGRRGKASPRIFRLESVSYLHTIHIEYKYKISNKVPIKETEEGEEGGPKKSEEIL